MIKSRHGTVPMSKRAQWLGDIPIITLVIALFHLPMSWATTQISESETLVLTSEEVRKVLKLSPLEPLRAVDPTNRNHGQSAAIDLGKRLFFETRLSKSGRYSCASCHIPARGWADGTPLTTLEVTLPRHTPSLWNVAFNRWFYWDGRADSLWAQALGPIESPIEMANDRTSVVRLLLEDDTLRPQYVRLFGQFPKSVSPDQLPKSAMPGPSDSVDPPHAAWSRLSARKRQDINRVFSNVGKAIAAFESTIISSNSPFDRFAEGLRTANARKRAVLSDSALRGLKLFVGEAKCAVCHSGPTFSDLEFHNVLLPSDMDALDDDRGRYDGIPKLRTAAFNSQSVYNDAAPGEYSDWVSYIRRTVENRRQFKTPTLRNVATTAPYMHTGQFGTLTEAIDHCGSMDESIDAIQHSEVVLSPVELTRTDIRDIVAFLESLTDESYLETFEKPSN